MGARGDRRLRVLAPLLVAAWGRTSSPSFHRILQEHLAHFICLTNRLQPLYDVLRQNELPLGTLKSIVASCNGTGAAAPAPLTPDGRFLSRFFVRNCDSWQEHPRSSPVARGTVAEVPRATLQEATEGMDFPRDRPTILALTQEQIERHVPRWLWDVNLYGDFEQDRTVVKPVPGHEAQLAYWPLFLQGLRPGSPAKAPRWRQTRSELEQTLGSVLEYRPGTLWIEPELWVQAKGRETTFHYDYDPLNLVFQVQGSRRFHILPPHSGALSYDFWDKPWKKPADYGTRWAKQVNETEEYIVELQPRDILVLPNGWPHRVKYTDLSLGYAVRSFTQCQALSLWLGQRLCTLSSIVGGPRMCFDDERFRERGGHRALEAQQR